MLAKSLFLLLCEMAAVAFAGLNITNCGWSTKTKIVGGSDSKPGEYPWQVSLTYNGQHLFGGSIVAPNLVVTCAHCVNLPDTSNIGIRAGITNLLASSDSSEQDLQVATILVHPAYNAGTMQNDVALLVLASSITFTANAHAICLPKAGASFVGQSCDATGWGLFNPKLPNLLEATLQNVQLPIVDTASCRQQLSAFNIGAKLVTSANLCAGYAAGGKDTCTYDGGGPLACLDAASNRYLLAGITSWGVGCAQRNSPGVYAAVASARAWIDAVYDSLGDSATASLARAVSAVAPLALSTTCAEAGSRVQCSVRVATNMSYASGVSVLNVTLVDATTGTSYAMSAAQVSLPAGQTINGVQVSSALATRASVTLSLAAGDQLYATVYYALDAAPAALMVKSSAIASVQANTDGQQGGAGTGGRGGFAVWWWIVIAVVIGLVALLGLVGASVLLCHCLCRRRTQPSAAASEKSKMAEIYAIAGSPSAGEDATRGAAVQSAIAPPTYENAEAHAASIPEKKNEDCPPSYLALFSHN